LPNRAIGLMQSLYVFPKALFASLEGEGRGGFWREENKEKIRKIFYIF
jgi:hypothetical protein